MSGLRSVRYSNARDRHKIESEYRRRFGIRMPTVIVLKWSIQFQSVQFWGGRGHCVEKANFLQNEQMGEKFKRSYTRQIPFIFPLGS